MAEKSQPPFIQHPEVRTSEQELRPALEMEQLVWQYKIKREERNAIFDEVKAILTYQDIKALLPTDFNLERLAQSVHLEDFLSFWNNQSEAVLRALAQAIKKQEAQVVEATATTAEAKVNMQKTINSRTIGKLTRLAYLLQFRFTPLSQDLSSYDEAQLEQISLYGHTQHDAAKQSIRKIDQIKRGVEVAKLSKVVEGLRSSKEVSAIYQTPQQSVTAFNTLLEQVISDETGQPFKFGIEQIYQEQGNLVNKEFLPAYINYRREMKQLHDLLERGKIVETDYVKDLIEYALPALRKDPPTIVYFHGDFGTGKTAMAVHIARTRFGKEPIIVAGNKYLEPDRFTEDFRITKLSEADFFNSIAKQLGIDQQFKNDAPIEAVLTALAGSKQAIRKKIVENLIYENYVHSLKDQEPSPEGFANFKRETLSTFWEGRIETEALGNLSTEELQKAFNIEPERMQDVQSQIDSLFTNQTMGRYVLGAMYEAMQTGRPLIIDEANAISPEVLIAFNDLITKKIGERIQVRADVGEIKVKEGYCIMWTGNTGERYKQARYNDMDPATYSRILPIQVRYLPQSREVNNMVQLLERLRLNQVSAKTFGGETAVYSYIKESHKQAVSDQIFQVLLLKILNARLGVEVLVKTENRYSLFEDLYRLSVGARLIMDLFEGTPGNNFPRLPNLDKLIGDNTTTTLIQKLKKSNLTMRELIDFIVGSYLDEGGSMDLEYYLWKYIKKYDMYPEDQAILYLIMKQVGFFASSDGWPNPAATTVRNLADFGKIMEFNPTTNIDKYKRIEKNGEYVSLLNTEGQYQLQYFSSPEILQLLFGFLPPRTKVEYHDLIKAQESLAKIPELREKQRELIEGIRDVISALTSSKIQEIFITAEKIVAFAKEYGQQPVCQTAFMTLSEERAIEAAENFYTFLLESLKLNDTISQADYEAGLAGDLDVKASIIKKALEQ